MKCEYCGADNPSNAKFCANCGKEFAIREVEKVTVDSAAEHLTCQNCGLENTVDAKFCQHCGQALTASSIIIEHTDESTSSTDTDPDSTDEYVSAIRFIKALRSNKEAKVRNDTVCPFCDESGCEFTQKNDASISNKNFNWLSGCCGMSVFGAFGLLCGLCGTGSKTKVKSETWWICKKCGKQHISISDAMKKWDEGLSSLWGTAASSGIIFAIFIWLFNSGIFSFVFFVIFAFFPIIAIDEFHKGISEELGEPLLTLLTPAQRKSCMHTVIFATLLAVALEIIFPACLGAILSK